jgi:hypothetical protein
MIFTLIEIHETNEKYTFNSTDFCGKRLLPNGDASVGGIGDVGI